MYQVQNLTVSYRKYSNVENLNLFAAINEKNAGNEIGRMEWIRRGWSSFSSEIPKEFTLLRGLTRGQPQKAHPFRWNRRWRDSQMLLSVENTLLSLWSLYHFISKTVTHWQQGRTKWLSRKLNRDWKIACSRCKNWNRSLNNNIQSNLNNY